MLDLMFPQQVNLLLKLIRKLVEGRDYTQRPKKEEDEKDDMLKRTQAFSKPAAKGIPAEYDVDRIKTNIELNKEVWSNVFLRQR